MRSFLALVLAATAAAAHGGGSFRDPPPRGIPCDCAAIECGACGGARLCGNRGVTVAQETKVVETFGGEFGLIRMQFTVTADKRPREAYIRLAPATLFAVASGGVAEIPLAADASEAARRRYLYAARLAKTNALFALRRGPGRLDLRLVGAEKNVSATLEGFVLLPRAAPDYVRLYRTGDRALAVVKALPGERAAFRERDTGRSFLFMTVAMSRARFPGIKAAKVPCVAAFEAALAKNPAPLVALAKDAPLPPFIGPDRFYGPSGGLPPPPPPPPPG